MELSYTSGNGNPEKIPDISGNGNPKKISHISGSNFPTSKIKKPNLKKFLTALKNLIKLP